MKDLGKLHFFLGLEIRYVSSGLFVSQHKYAKDLLHKASLDECNTHLTPCMSVLCQALKGHWQTYIICRCLFFRSLVGCLQYHTFTRLDISYSVNSVCQFMHCPNEDHLVEVKRILRYVKQSLTLALCSGGVLVMYLSNYNYKLIVMMQTGQEIPMTGNLLQAL